MKQHNDRQREHYESQYRRQSIHREIPEDLDLWEWGKWYPLLMFEDFCSTLRHKSILTICSGAGRELAVFSRYDTQVTATDLTIEHLNDLVNEGLIENADVQNAERLTYADNEFNVGFVNAGLHHLSHPHSGLNELLRVSSDLVVFIESQDSILFKLRKLLGKTKNDFEPAGNYVYRWGMREIEKICASAHTHSYAVKTAFLPISTRMRGVKGKKKKAIQEIQKIANYVFGSIGNVMITIIFKQPPTEEQLSYLRKHGYTYKITLKPDNA